MIARWPALAACVVALASVPASAQEEVELPPTKWLDNYRLRLDFHPIGQTLDRGDFKFSSLIRMYPPGFRADEYDMLFAPTYGLADGLEITAGVTTAERLGRGGEAVFYGAGIQKQIFEAGDWLPSISIGAFGVMGPHDHTGGSLYLAATQRVFGGKIVGKRIGPTLFLHGGVKYEFFDSDDYDNSSGVRPFVGASMNFTRRVALTGEYSPGQAWQPDDMWSVRASYRIHRFITLSGGIRSNGFDTHPFFSFGF
jgi:hypothetical protein